ncbi:MBL fold metallo-hydrolase [Streptomyces olivoreticuli]
MPASKGQAAPLQYSVFVSQRPGLNRQLPAGFEALSYVPNSSTLIYGERDAVVVDTPLTVEANQALIDWIVASGKNLTTIYLTHGHGDHCFGIRMIKERFPEARAIARPGVVQHMIREMSSPFVDDFWISRFPGQVPKEREAAEPLSGRSFELEGQQLVTVDTGYTDTPWTTGLHVPSIGLLVAGDAAYNGVHPYMAEGSPASWLDWIAALAELETLQPRFVVAGHKRPELDDDPKIIEETRAYFRDFMRLDAETDTARDLFDRMMELHGDRANPGSLWGATTAAKTPRGIPTATTE